jgi:hypothetical protein
MFLKLKVASAEDIDAEDIFRSYEDFSSSEFVMISSWPFGLWSSTIFVAVCFSEKASAKMPFLNL